MSRVPAEERAFWVSALERLHANVQRANRLARISALPVEELGQTYVQDGHSPRADLARAEVVFLHAASEEFLRTGLRAGRNKFVLNSGNNATEALRRCGFDVQPFALACGWLGALTQRRTEIVHFADRSAKEGEQVRPWLFGDTLVLFMGRLAAYTLFFEAKRQVGCATLVDEERRRFTTTGLQEIDSWATGVLEVTSAGGSVGDWPAEPFSRLRRLVAEKRTP